MTSMWMVQNDDGRYLIYDPNYEEFKFLSKNSGFVTSHVDASEFVTNYGGHLVEMVPAKPKVPVSQEEAGLVEDIADDTSIVPASTIGSYVISHYADAKDWSSEQFRLMEAVIDGYEVVAPVVAPTKYNVKVPHTTNSWYAKRSNTGKLNTWDKYDDAQMRNSSVLFTMAEIKHYGLEDCERVEINTEDSNDD